MDEACEKFTVTFLHLAGLFHHCLLQFDQMINLGMTPKYAICQENVTDFKEMQLNQIKYQTEINSKTLEIK